MYLERRRRLWYALHDIPKSAQQALGRKRFVQSLETEDRNIAERRAAVFAVKWRGAIEQAHTNNGDHIERDARFWRNALQDAPEEERVFEKLSVPKPGKNGKADERAPFTPADVVKLLKAAHADDDEELASLIELGMYSGARIEELCALPVERVGKDHFEIADAKTPAGWRQVPIHSKLKRTVARLVGKRRDGYLLAGLVPNKYGDRSNAIGKRFGRLKTALGFGKRHVFHSIRRTVATLLENAAVPEGVSADIIGHEKTTMTYGLCSGGASLEVKGEAIEKLRYS